MSRGRGGEPPAFARDLAAGLLPWVCYWLGSAAGRPAPAALLAAMLLALIRLSRWWETKAFEVAIGGWFLLVALDRGPLPLAVLDGWRPALLPLLLAATAFGSLALDRPCTLQYARPRLDQRWWGNIHFLRVNRILTAMWGGAFLAMAGLALALPASPAGRISAGVGSAGLFAAAVWVTLQLPYYYRMRYFLPRVRAGQDTYHPAPRRPRWMKCRRRRRPRPPG